MVGQKALKIWRCIVVQWILWIMNLLCVAIATDARARFAFCVVSLSILLETWTSLLHPFSTVSRSFARCHRITSHIHQNARRYQKYQTNQRQITEIPTERPCHHHRLTMSCQLNNMRLFFEFFSHSLFRRSLFASSPAMPRHSNFNSSDLQRNRCNYSGTVHRARKDRKRKQRKHNNNKYDSTEWLSGRAPVHCAHRNTKKKKAPRSG